MALNQVTHHQSGHERSSGTKGPRKNPYRDGISKSHQQYDLYEAIRYPNRARSSRPPIAPCSNDGALSKQKQLEKVIYEKFIKGKGFVFAPAWRLLRSCIKFLFLFLALPPYILFYLLPRKIFIEMIPYGMRYLKSHIKHLKQRLINSIRRLLKSSISPFLQVWYQLKILIHREKTAHSVKNDNKSTGFFAFLTTGVWLMIKPGINLGLGIYRTVKSIMTFIYQFPKKVQKTIQAFIQRINQIKATLQAFFRRVKRALKTALDWRVPVTRMNHTWKFIQSRWQKAFASFSLKKILVLRRRGEKFLSQFTELVTNLKHRLAKVKKKMLTFRSFYLRTCWMKFMNLQKKIKENLSKIKFYFQYKPRLQFSKIILLFQQRYLQLVQTKDKLQHFFIRLRAKFHYPTRILPIQTALQRGIRITSSLFQIGKRIFIPGISLAERTTRILLKKLQSAYILIAEITFSIRRTLLPKIHHLKKSAKPVVEVWQRIAATWILQLRICLAWSHILLQYGMVLLGQTAQQLGFI